MSPQSPRYVGQLGVTRCRAEIDETLLKRSVRAIARIAPHLAIGHLRLFISRRKQRAVVLLCQRLPMQVESACQPRLARAFAAAVLVHNHATERLHMLRNPDRVVD